MAVKFDQKVVVFVSKAQKSKLIDEAGKRKKAAMKDGKPGQNENVSSVLRSLMDQHL